MLPPAPGCLPPKTRAPTTNTTLTSTTTATTTTISQDQLEWGKLWRLLEFGEKLEKLLQVSDCLAGRCSFISVGWAGPCVKATGSSRTAAVTERALPRSRSPCLPLALPLALQVVSPPEVAFQKDCSANEASTPQAQAAALRCIAADSRRRARFIEPTNA